MDNDDETVIYQLRVRTTFSMTPCLPCAWQEKGKPIEIFPQRIKRWICSAFFVPIMSPLLIKRTATSTRSPLQFQKQVRLQEARRLMLGEELNTANAGLRVGYEDPAYSSRDYKKCSTCRRNTISSDYAIALKFEKALIGNCVSESCSFLTLWFSP